MMHSLSLSQNEFILGRICNRMNAARKVRGQLTSFAIAIEPWHAVHMELPKPIEASLLYITQLAVAKCVVEAHDMLACIRNGNFASFDDEMEAEHLFTPEVIAALEGDWNKALDRWEEIDVLSARVSAMLM